VVPAPAGPEEKAAPNYRACNSVARPIHCNGARTFYLQTRVSSGLLKLSGVGRVVDEVDVEEWVVRLDGWEEVGPVLLRSFLLFSCDCSEGSV